MQNINWWTQYPQYKHIFIKFMSFVDGIWVWQDQHFEINQLQNLCHLMSIATLLACIWQVRARTRRPTYGCMLNNIGVPQESDLLLYAKSWQTVGWAPEKWKSRSNLVSSLFSVIWKKRSESKGQASQARWEMEHSKFEQLLMKLQEFPDLKQCFAFPMMAKFQYNMMAHLDDTLRLNLDV